ncbi:MAG: hypothetical protein Q4D97_02345 [Eubacteriales bacterium]|nr:hypothetical protein [Eubacteriales bacterium]
MDKQASYNFWKYPWQKYALMVGVVLVLALLIGDIRELQFFAEMKDQMYSSWDVFQSRKFLSFAFYGVILLNLIGQLLIGRFGETQRKSYVFLFILLLVSSLVIALTGLIVLNKTPAPKLKIAWLLFLTVWLANTVVVGIKLRKYSAQKA